MDIVQIVKRIHSGQSKPPIESIGVKYLDGGYYGDVYLLPCGEKVLKVNRLDTSDSTKVGAFEEVKREFDVLRTLQGLPCIPKLHTYTPTYGVMDYIKGSSLAEMSDEDIGKIPVEEWFVFFHTIVKMRERGVYHRDMNATNILVTTDYKLYLIDFGLYSFSSRHKGNIPLPYFLQMEEEEDFDSLRKPYQEILHIGLTVYDFDLDFHEDHY